MNRYIIKGCECNAIETVLRNEPMDSYQDAINWVNSYTASDNGGYEFMSVYIWPNTLDSTKDDGGHWEKY